MGANDSAKSLPPIPLLCCTCTQHRMTSLTALGKSLNVEKRVTEANAVAFTAPNTFGRRMGWHLDVLDFEDFPFFARSPGQIERMKKKKKENRKKQTCSLSLSTVAVTFPPNPGAKAETFLVDDRLRRYWPQNGLVSLARIHVQP